MADRNVVFDAIEACERTLPPPDRRVGHFDGSGAADARFGVHRLAVSAISNKGIRVVSRGSVWYR